MKTSKSKAEWKQIIDVRDPAFGHATHEHEYAGERPNGFHHVWVDPQNERWLAKDENIIARMEANQARFPSLLQSSEDDRREHENDLRHESLMADESEHGPRCNLPNDEAWRQ